MSSESPVIVEIAATPCLKGPEEALRQFVHVTIEYPGSEPLAAGIFVDMAGERLRLLATELQPGRTQHEMFLPVVSEPATLTFLLRVGDKTVHTVQQPWRPPRRWTVHVVQLSHHDYGYTDLPSRVISEHARHLDQAVEYAYATASHPDEAQFRIVIEQAWSLQHYLRQRPESARERMLDLLRSGRFEVTALFGNLTTEICSSEVLARAVQQTAAWKRDYGLPIISAEHNDIPGISWGLCTLLTDVGVEFLAPGLPLYWSWGQKDKLASFWDEQKIFGRVGVPGCFWWEAPTGKRLLFWSNNRGCGGSSIASMPQLTAALQQYANDGYPYDVIRWPVSGAARDNAPYRIDYAYHIKAWNETWTWPRLICSTNARFWSDLRGRIPADLPVWRGDLPGPDYPVGAASTAAATATDRRTHAALLTAEKLATCAAALANGKSQQATIRDAYEQTLFFDLHAWGYHFPAGPAAVAAHDEKVAHASRAAALAHEVTNKALARIADQVRIKTPDCHLLVFNPLAQPRTAPVNAPLRELDNCGSEIVPVSADDGQSVAYMRGCLLNDHWHVNPPPELVDGKFDLIDLSANETVPFQITEIQSPYAAVPYAAQRLALGSGSARYGAFETPLGVKRTLQFMARDVPAGGYKTYRLTPREQAPPALGPLRTTKDSIENEYYRIMVAGDAGKVCSIFDKTQQRELLDPQAPHAFGHLIVRQARDAEKLFTAEMSLAAVNAGPVAAAIDMTGSVYGHPIIAQSLTLYAGDPRIHLGVSVLKDATGLLAVQMALPFAVERPRFRYAAPFGAVEPVTDFLPGAHADRVAVGDWVSVGNNAGTVLCAALDSPVMSFAHPWPGYTSPAHSCFFDAQAAARHKTLTLADLDRGHLYPLLFANNFGTNFYATQPGDALFRFVFACRPGQVGDAEAAQFGAEAAAPFEQIFTQHDRQRHLPVSDSLLRVDNAAVQVVTLKEAEDGDGLILRLWNATAERQAAQVTLGHVRIEAAQRASLAEEPQGEPLEHTAQTVSATLGPYEPCTIRLKV